MSLGWQTESALLPSNSKPINVDGKSLVGLKALLYDQQQQRTSGHDSNVRNARSVYSKRKEDKAAKSLLDNSSSSKNSTSNKNDDEPNVLAALTAKSKLYEEISSGKVKLQSDVVNFEDKVDVESMQHKVRTAYVPPPLPPSMPNPAKKAEKAPEVRTSDPQSSGYTYDSAQSSAQPQWNWSKTYGSADNDPNVNPAGSYDYNSEYRDKIRGETELKRAVEGRIQTEVGCSANTTATSGNSGEYRVSEAARVKSQWEKTLNSSARNFLEQVHDDTTVQRAAVTSQATSAEGSTQKRSLREEKLELIRQKRSKIV